MFDASIFAAFARRVPPVPPTIVTGGTTALVLKTHSIQALSVSVPPVPPVPRQNNDAMNEERLRDLFEERAAIMEFDAGMSREAAEREAWLDVYGERPRHE